MLHSAFALPGALCAAHHGTAFLPAGFGVLFFTAGESLPLRQNFDFCYLSPLIKSFI
jgi:hypothetical protein